MYVYGKRRADPKTKIDGSKSFSGGLSQNAHPAVIKPTQLAEAQNAMYVQNGVVEKRPGCIEVGIAEEGEGSPFYLGNIRIGNDRSLYKITSNGIFKRYVRSSNIWVVVAGAPVFTKETDVLQGWGWIVFYNDTDNIASWDGTTWITFDPVDNPTAAPTYRRFGYGLVTELRVTTRGTGYSINDMLTVTAGDNNCEAKVLAVNDGKVQELQIVNAGTGYLTANGVSTVSSPDTGTGCKVDIVQTKGSGYDTYKYSYCWYNKAGHTSISPAVVIENMPITLDDESYVELTIPAPPEGQDVDTVSIFRTQGVAPAENYLDSMPATQTVYIDKGGIDLDANYASPEENTTEGLHFKFAVVYRDSIVGVSVEYGDDTIVVSAGAEEFMNFAVSYGARYYSWFKKDDDELRGLKTYKEKLYIFKRNKVGAFSFLSDGSIKIEEITLASGCLSHDSVHSSGNEIRYFGPDGPMTLGYEANYGDVVRTRVIGADVDTIISTITSQDEQKISSIFYKGISMWGIPRGTVGSGVTSTLTLNERFIAWSEWVGFKPKQFCKFVDNDNKERLFFSTPTSGKIYEAWQGKNDDGERILFRLSTKQYNQDLAYAYKTFSKLYYVFGNVVGGGTRIVYIKDGYKRSEPRALYLNRSGRIGFGVDKWGTIMWGTSSGDYSSDVSGINIRFIELNNQEMFSLQTEISNDGLEDIIQVMSVFIEYADSTLPLSSDLELPIDYSS